ncbi:MAG TPA: GNAT family protein, partial [Flavisolibacter sp.]|nr:GNAT family protein [Flavisolibacter sp.]
QLISWIDSEELLMQFAGPEFRFPLTKEQLDKSVNDSNRYAFKVVDAEQETIGHAEIYLTENSACLCRIIIGEKELRGKGVGQLIVRLLLNFAFTELNQDKAELNVFDWNTTAIKCYEKAGFVVSPSKKLERTVNGKVWTAVNMVKARKPEDTVKHSSVLNT